MGRGVTRVACCLAMLGLAVLAQRSASATGPAGGPPPIPTPAHDAGQAGGSSSGAAPPTLLASYGFNGDLTDDRGHGVILQMMNDLNMGQEIFYEAGKNGKTPGAIRGLAFMTQPNPFVVYEQMTVSFTVFPKTSSPTGGVYGCETGTAFSNQYKNHGSWATGVHAYQDYQVISVKACPPDASGSGSVSIFYYVTPPADAAPTDNAVVYAVPLTSNVWHDVSVVFDKPAGKVSIVIDGKIAGTAPTHGPMKVGPAQDNRVLMGGPRDTFRGWEAGAVDVMRVYAGAVYPQAKEVPRAVGPVPVKQSQ